MAQIFHKKKFLLLFIPYVCMPLASKQTRLEVNADKTKYMVKSRDQNAVRSHNIKSFNSSFEGVKEFKYLGKKLNESKFCSGRN